MNNYYAKFNENGERETSIVFSVHYATEEELQLYLDQGFERNHDRRPGLANGPHQGT